jgi:hypothetical protein
MLVQVFQYCLIIAQGGTAWERPVKKEPQWRILILPSPLGIGESQDGALA